MKTFYYGEKIDNFLIESTDSIIGKLVKNHKHKLEEQQRNAWIYQIEVLKRELSKHGQGHIFFEFRIPRMGKRVDVIAILQGLIFVLEFKVGEKDYHAHALVQVLDYSLDLKNFHEGSYEKAIVPVLISSNGKTLDNEISMYEDLLYQPIKLNDSNIAQFIGTILEKSNYSVLMQ